MEKKVLIVQNYNINKGDTSVVFAMKKSLLDMYSDLTISLTSYDPVKAKKEYQLNSAEWLLDYRMIKSSSKIKKIYYFFIELLWLVYSIIWIFGYRINLLSENMIPKKKKDVIRLYIQADVVVLPGGHFFTTLNKFPVLFSHFYAMFFAKMLGKKCMIYAQTFGPFLGIWASISKFLSLKAIKFCDVVSVREEDSLRYNVDKKMIVTAESVFATKTKNDFMQMDKSEFGCSNEQALVGITIHHIYYSQFYSREEYISLMSRIINKIIITYKCKILFIPMETYRAGNPGDRNMIGSISEKITDKDAISIVQEDLSSFETERVIASTDIFIGTKTHSVVYSLKNTIPTIAIAYQEKTNQFMLSLGVRENSINLKELECDEFMQIFKRVFENREKYSKIEADNLKRVTHKAENNNRLLYQLILKEK